MESIERSATEFFVQKIPTGFSPVSLEELQEAGLPEFLIRRIGQEVERSLADSLPLPESPWVDMETPRMQKAWDRFLQEALQEAEVPREELFDVIETAVSDCIQLLTQPRRLIPKKLFGHRQHLSEEQLEAQADRVVVYRELAQAPLKYMRRKNLDSLSYDQAVYVISRVDEKLSELWKPSDWVQMLDPLFELLQGEVEGELLNRFFQDKNRTDLARRFGGFLKVGPEQLEEMLQAPEEGRTVAGGIYVVSAADEGSEGQEERTVKWPPIETGRGSGIPKEEEEEPWSVMSSGQGSGITGEQASDDEISRPRLAEEAGSGEAGAGSPFSLQGSEGEAEEIPLYARFMQVESEEESGEAATGADQESEPAFPDSPAQDEIMHDLPDRQEFVEIVDDGDGHAGSSENGSGMFRYVDEMSSPEGRAKETSVGQPEELIDWLGESERFTHAIFRDSEESYRSALDELSRMSDWQEATRFIQGIFRQYGVDVFDDAAVDFTDRLHTWFLEK